ncbi:hypothetical protein [Bdellovibrio sp. NC01]|uniref:hypothetical protein n=1 Tax=Bdellovibrio sp. NC01 TaxID=2220073 RepID=UPI001157521A|nr:hypothetical protein [Bdellovibrio sp. NC01]QDK36398.1 hypothetical protein DOE51_01675 [Bdellovibrio sp. NC01]
MNAHKNFLQKLGLKSDYCALCQESNVLEVSHIIPAFVVKWKKDTSATGFLRSGESPNRRVQDGAKIPLLCRQCEQLFSRWESEFAAKVFHPYVKEELSENAVAQLIVNEIEYDSWLLKFCLSLQWRGLISTYESEELPANQFEEIKKAISVWRDFLLGRRETTGEWRSYIFFLQNVAEGEGRLPAHAPVNINHYVLRASEITILDNPKKLIGYAKIGPILIYTAMIPNEFKYHKEYQVRLKGKLKTGTSIHDPEFGKYLLIDRPKELLKEMEMSDRQWQLIQADYAKNPDRVAKSLTKIASDADFKVQQDKLKK